MAKLPDRSKPVVENVMECNLCGGIVDRFANHLECRSCGALGTVIYGRMVVPVDYKPEREETDGDAGEIQNG